MSSARPDPGDPPPVDILAARFDDPARARAAARDIRVRLRVPPDAIDIRPLGTTEYDRPASDVLLAGRFPEDLVEPATMLVESYGGRVVDRRNEAELYPAVVRKPRRPESEAERPLR